MGTSVGLRQTMKQQNVDLIERWIQSKNSQPTPEEENQLSSRSIERPAILDEVAQLVKNTQMHLKQLRQEAEVHSQRLQEFQKEVEACSTSTENAETDSDEGTSIDYFKRGLQVESPPKEVKKKLPQLQDKGEDEKKDDGTEKLLNTDNVQSNKDKTQPEEKYDAKRVDEKDTDDVQQVDKNKEKEQLISDKKARLATETLMALKADVAKTLEGLQSMKMNSVELPDSSRQMQYHRQQVVPSDKQNRHKVIVNRPCRAKPHETQGVDVAAKRSKDVDRNRHSKMEVHKVQTLDNVDKLSVDTSKHSKTKLHKAPSLENVNQETVDKIRHTKAKLDEIQRLENAAEVSEGEPKDRHSKPKSFKSQTTEDAVKASDKENNSKIDPQGSAHHVRRSKRKHRERKDLSEIPPTPVCSCSSLMILKEAPKSLPPADQREPSDKTSEKHTTKSKDIRQVVMSHKTSQTTSNTSIVHLKEEVRSTIQQVHNTKQLTVQQLPSLNIRRTLSVQKVPSVQIPPPGAAVYVSPRQNIAFWGMSQDDAAVEVQKYGSSTNLNNNVDTVKEEPQRVLTLEEPTLPQWKDDFTETEMYMWFCEVCRSMSEHNVNVPESQFLSQCKECLRHFPITELFQQHCIECQVVKKETRLDQCAKCLCSVPSIEIINNHCLGCQSVETFRFYQEALKTGIEKQNNLQISQTEKVDLPEKEVENNKEISNIQQQRNVFSYTVQRKETEQEAYSKKEKQPAHASRPKSVEFVPEYSRNDYQIKGDILSSLGEEEIMKELEPYLTKEIPDVAQDFLDITGQSEPGDNKDISNLQQQRNVDVVELENNKDVSNIQQQRNVFSCAAHRKETEHEADNKKEIQLAHASKQASVECVPEYSRYDYQIKGDILSSLGEEEIMKELESYLTKEFSNVAHDFLDSTGQLSDVSSLEEYLHSKGQDTECNLSDTELGELILNSLSARLQQQTIKSCDWMGNVNTVFHEKMPVTMLFMAESSEGSDHSGKKSSRSQRAKSAPGRQLCNERVNPPSIRASPIPDAKYSRSKYHQHCFDNNMHPTEPVKINYPTLRNKKAPARKSPRPKKGSADIVKEVKKSTTPKKAHGQDTTRTPRQINEQDVMSKIEEEESKNKLQSASSYNDAEYDTDSVPVSPVEEHEHGTITEESYEDDWEEESEHSAAEGVKLQAESRMWPQVEARLKSQAEAGTQTDTAALVATEHIREIQIHRATSPIALNREMVTVDVQTTTVIVSLPPSESPPPPEATPPAAPISLPPSESTPPAAAILINKLQNACKCSSATEQALRVVIGEKQMCSLADKLQIVCNCPTHPTEVPRETLVDNFDTPTSPICPSEDELKVLCMSPSTCRTLHKTVANATKGARKSTLMDKATSPKDNARIKEVKKVRLVDVHTSYNREQIPVAVQTSQEFDQGVCTSTTCPAKLGQTNSHQEDKKVRLDVHTSYDTEQVSVAVQTLEKLDQEVCSNSTCPAQLRQSKSRQEGKKVRLVDVHTSYDTEQSSAAVQTLEKLDQEVCSNSTCPAQLRQSKSRQEGKKVRLVDVHTSYDTEQSSAAVQNLQMFDPVCTNPTCPAQLRKSKSHHGSTSSSSTDDEYNKISEPSSRPSDDEMTSTSQTHSEPVTSTGSTDSEALQDHPTISQGEVLFDMQRSEGEMLAPDFTTSVEDTLSAEATSEKVLNVVNFWNSERRVQSKTDEDEQSDGEMSEGQVYLL